MEQIVATGIDQANRTRAAIRLPLSSTTRMVLAVTDLEGNVVGLYRMPDATVFSLDVAPLLPAASAFLLVAVSLGFAFGVAVLGRIVFRSYVQAAVPPPLLARVNASMRVVAWGGVPIGAFAGGTLTQLIGVRWMIGLGSGLALLLFLAFAVASETKRI